MKLLCALFATALLTGCVHNYKLHPISRTEPLRSNTLALIVVPTDGAFEQIKYPGSGRQVARVVATAFAGQGVRVDLIESNQTARLEEADYLVTPRIAHWEDRATEWSGRSDRIEIELRTQRARDGMMLNLGSVEGKSRWGTLGGDSPEDMLEKPINEYVHWLFQPLDVKPPKFKEPEPAAPHNQQQR